MKSKIKRLFLDIETSYSVVATFSLWPKYISHDNILEDWHVICAAWKWEGSTKIEGKLTYNNNDKTVVASLRKAIVEADEIVYHNGRKFDFKKLNTRVLLNNLDPMPKPRETDTLIQVRKHFSLSSNRLDFVGKALGVGGKLKTSPDLWMKALKKDKKAIDEMFKYNKQDVIVLENIFNKLKPYIEVGYNLNINQELGHNCPKCGSDNLQARGYDYTKTAKYRRFQCKVCASWSRAGTKENKGSNSPVR